MFKRNKKNKNMSLQDLAKEEHVDIFRVDRDAAVKLMANEILGVPTHVQVGHKNGNPFDNRRCNLYIIDPERS